MKINLIFFFALFFSPVSFCQTKPFEQGFGKGFKEGYCYNQSITCIAPLTPNCPLPRVNENENNFTDGYNRGFQTGLDLRRVEEGRNSSKINYQSVPNYRFNDYIPEVPINDYVNVLLYKRALMEKRLDWINKRIQDIGDLNYVLLLNTNKEAYDFRLNELNNFVDNQLKTKRPDLTNNAIFNKIVEIFSAMQSGIYEDYSYAKTELEKFIIDDDISLSESKMKLFATFSNNEIQINGLKVNSSDTIRNLRLEKFSHKLDQQGASDENIILYVYLNDYESYYQINYGFLKKNFGKKLAMDFIGSSRVLAITNYHQYIIAEDGKPKYDVEALGEKHFLTKSGKIFNGFYYKEDKEGKYYVCPYEIQKEYFLAYPLYTIFR
jgi:hypothetical protein